MRAAALAAIAALLAVGVVVEVEPVAAESVLLDCAAFDPFTPELAQLVEQRFAGHHVSAAVYDTQTGCAFTFRPGERVTTASVLKVELYAGILLRAQAEGRWLRPDEAAGAWPMITVSANEPATAFFRQLGSVAGVAALSRDLGMVDTQPAEPWGRTVTSAQDQVHLLRRLLLDADGPLAPPYRAALVDAMSSVVPSQRWGVSAGVPPGWTVALKNGFALSTCCGWRVNSVGWVHPPDSSGYVVAILSDGWPDQATGVAAVEVVSQAIAARLAPDPYLGFPSRASFVDRVHRDVVGVAPPLPTLLGLANAAGWGGAGAPTLLDGLLGSDASGRGDLVAALYRGLLGRGVDPGGLAHWRGVVRAGGTGALAAGLLATDELRAAGAGLDDAGFVHWAYERLLGRPPDPAGAAWWLGELRRAGRPAVILALAAAPEAWSRLGPEAVVVQVYDAFLHRLPTDAEVAAWRGTDRAALALAAVSSDEHRTGGR